MKAIIFDVDGVIIISAEEKTNRIKEILRKYGLYNVDWVPEILAMSLNRVLLLDKIWEIVSFDKQKVLEEIHTSLEELEYNPPKNIWVVDFIKDNHDKYLFFTNTSLPKKSLETTLNALWIMHCFKELFAGEDGMKLENTYSILEKYSLNPEEVLFIDDTLSHVTSVSESWVNTLYFDNFDIDITIELNKYLK